jgi:hypothetical protein
MNTGIQDAVNLAWKVAFQLQGKGKAELLQSYAQERYRAVRRVLASTHDNTLRILQQSTADWEEEHFHVSFRNRAAYRGLLPQEFSGLGADHGIDPGSLTGRHVPYGRIEGIPEAATTYDVPRVKRNVVILADGVDHQDVAALTRRFNKVLTVAPPACVDSPVSQALGLDKHEVCLIRPDGYVGHQGSFKELEGYLHSFYNANMDNN